MEDSKKGSVAAAKEKKHVGIGAWVSLVVFILILSGIFMKSDTPLKVLDFTNLTGNFGMIGDTKMNLIGANGSGAKDGFMAGLNLLPGVMLFCGLMSVFKAFLMQRRFCSNRFCARFWASREKPASRL